MAAKRGGTRKASAKKRGAATRRRTARAAAAKRASRLPAEQEPIALKDEKVEEALQSGEQSGLLEDYFGPGQYAELRRLAQEAAARGRRGGERVFILPGIMGSKLGYDGPLIFDDVIWANPVTIALGRLSELTLGGPHSGIDPLGVILFAYLKLKLKLQIAGYDADFFPYDWRLGLEDLGKKLAATIKQEKDTVHLVAHSMGGLVARAALHNNPKKLGRIVMLGTPNFGSFSPIQAFRGAHSIVQKLDFIDRFHSQAELAQIFGTFPGLCEMIPSPQKYPADFFQPGSWPRGGPHPTQAMLTSALKVQNRLPADYDDLVIIAGVDQETTVDARVENDEFVYDISPAGDGTVPLQCVLLPGARHTYYVVEEHGSLPNNDKVAEAVDSILATGKTTALPDQYQPRRAAPIRSVSERTLETPPFPGNRGRALSTREKRALMEEFAAPDKMRAGAAPLDLAPSPAAAASTAEADVGISDSIVIGRRRQHRLSVTLAYGSITEVRADAYVLGLFKFVPPAGAASAVNDLMGGAIDEMVARRMFNANVGEISVLPNGKHPLRADFVAFAGLGPFDTYSEEVLEIVGENLVRTFINSRIDDFATVPIGGGSGTFTAEALRRMLTGFLRGLQDADRDHSFRGITICETDKDRFMALQQEFYRLCGTSLFDGVEATLCEVELPQPVRAVARRDATAVGPEDVILIVRQESAESVDPIEYGCSVLTAGTKATIFKARKRVGRAALEGHLAKLGTAEGLSVAALPKFGTDLTALVLPESIGKIIERFSEHPLVIVHDAATSRIPWETLQINGKFPALEEGLSHRYEAEDLSVAKWLEERRQDPTLDILLVTDPTEDLPGAEAEGARVEELFKKLRSAVTITKLFQRQARKHEVLKCLSSGRFDVLHYAGHAYFDQMDPSKSGIVCAGNEVLAGADLINLGALPSLVFFNACESGRLRRGAKTTQIDEEKDTIKRVKRGVSFAEAFLRGGIANYLGTYWPVNDNAALKFSEVFYEKILDHKPLGEAVMAGREAVEKLRSVDWADYILYGDPRFVVKTSR
jgi:pimeloyl-ACP methyl ester carboxylesterase